MTHLHPAINKLDHSVGPEDAPVSLVEYGDYQCPHCRIASRVVDKLIHHFGARLRFVYRHFPLTEMHEMAEPAAEAAEFASSADQFWPMHHALYAHQSELSDPSLVELAEGLGLDADAAGNAISSKAFTGRIQKDVAGALHSGVHATPTFFINAAPYAGSADYESLAAAIEAA